MKTRSLAVLMILVAGMVVGSGSTGATDRSAVKIGVVLSLSGPGAVFGIPARDAILAVAPKHNTTKRSIELLIHDDKTNPTEAARVVTQVINNDKVVAIIGPGTGSNFLAVAPVAERMRVPLLSVSGTVAVTDRKNSFYAWAFRIAPSDRDMVKAIVQDIAKSKVKKVGVFYQEDAYGKTGFDLAKEFSGALGLDVVEAVSAPYNATDLAAQATRLRSADVDAVLLQLSIPALGSSFTRAARQVGLTVPIYANVGLAQRSFADSAGADAEGLRVLSGGNLPYEPSPEEAKLAELLKAAGKVPQGWGEIVGANAFMTVRAAVDALGDREITGESMRSTIETLCDFPAYSRGKACFSSDKHDGWGEDMLVITELRDKQLRTPR